MIMMMTTLTMGQDDAKVLIKHDG